MKVKFRKRIISLITCTAIALSCVTMSGFAAFADADDEGGERTYVTESSWEMTVPQIFVYTENGNGTELQKEDGYQNAKIFIKDTDGSMLTDDCTFKVRGNTTALSWVTKKPYTFKFGKKKDVLGLGKGKKWALIANAFDPSMLRNYTVFSLAREMGLSYTSNFKAVEVWVDGSFRGFYFLFEPVQEGKDRVDIDIEGSDGKKDFLIEYEAQREEEDVTYFKAHGLRFIASEPEEPTDEQLEYIKSTMENIIKIMYNGDRDEAEEVIDIDSFAKFYLLNEFAKTFDFDMSSVFFYYKDGKLYAGPPWDYDLSLGNGNTEYGKRGIATYEAENLTANKKNIFKYLCKNKWFSEAVREVYIKYYHLFDSVGADNGLLDNAKQTYSEAIERNASEANWKANRWWINIMMKPFKTYDENFAYLKDWCVRRNTWLSNYFDVAYLRGDSNKDMAISVDDVTEIQRLLAEFDSENKDSLKIRGDINGDGRVNISDATEIQRFIAEIENPYNIGEKIVPEK